MKWLILLAFAVIIALLPIPDKYQFGIVIAVAVVFTFMTTKKKRDNSGDQ